MVDSWIVEIMKLAVLAHIMRIKFLLRSELIELLQNIEAINGRIAVRKSVGGRHGRKVITSFGR
jgi:hypothetical protein